MRRPATTALLSALAAAAAAPAAPRSRSCTLARARNETLLAGLFADGNLVAQVFPSSAAADAVTFAWEAPDACAARACELRAFAGAPPAYTWRGVVGTTGQQTGFSVFNGLNFMQDFAIAGGVGALTHGYTEQTTPLALLFMNDTTAPRPMGHSDYHRILNMVATDGEIVYYANTGLFTVNTSFFYIPSTFVIAYDANLSLSTGWCEHQFAAGRAVCETGAGQAPCQKVYDGCNSGDNSGYYSSVIDFAHTPNEGVNGSFPDAATGIAVQRSPGALLAVAHGLRAADNLRLFDKKSGAGVCNYTLDAPRALAFAPDGRALYAVVAGGVARYALPPACAPGGALVLDWLVTTVGAPGALAVAPQSGRVFVVDKASSQVRVLDGASGGPSAPLSALGRAGGYADGNTTPAVDKFWLPDNARGGFVAVDDDEGEGVWVSDEGNRRILHLDSRTGAELPGSIAYLTAVYRSSVHPRAPNRVFANYLEFDVDLAAADVGASWRLARNWAAGLNASFLGDPKRFAWSGFQQIGAALGLTVGAIDFTAPNSTSSSLAAVLLDDAASPPALRLLQLFDGKAPLYQVTPSLHPDGAMRYTRDMSDKLTNAAWQEIWEMPFVLDRDGTGSPGWEEPGRRIASFNVTANRTLSFEARAGGVPPRYPVTADGARVVLLDASRAENGGAHLGAIDVNATALAWTAAPWGSWNRTQGWSLLRDPASGEVVNVTTSVVSNPTGVYGAANPGTNYAAGAPAVLASLVVFPFFGEGWDGWEANQFLHFTTDGLFVGQFGTPNFPALTNASTERRHFVLAGAAGNSFSPSLVRDPGSGGIFWIHNDENQHGGVHVWSIDGGAEWARVAAACAQE
jgi:hypothetical protein